MLSWIDRSRTAKHRTAAALAALARRRGADEGVLDAAVAGTHDRSAEATLQMIRWAQALAGTAATPRYFRPAAYLDAATIDRLRHDSTQRDRSDPHLVRQLWSLAPKENMDALRREVADRLPGMVNELIPSHATTNTSASQLAAIDAVTRALYEASINA